MDQAKYEIMFILDAELGEQKTKKEIDEIRHLITSGGGEISAEDIWGVQDFAYTIKKRDKGYYVVINFTLPSEKVKEMESHLNLNSNVIRYLIIKTRSDYTLVTLEEYKERNAKEEEEERKEKEEKEKEQEKKRVKKPVKKVEKKAEKVEEKNEKKEAVTEKKKESKQDLEEVDKKLKSIIDDPDISL